MQSELKIGVNAQALNDPSYCGINTFFSNVLKSLNRIDQSNQYYLCSSSPINMQGLHSNFTNPLGKSLGAFSFFGFSKIFAQADCDVAFVPKETVPFFIKKPVVITVYDLFFIKFYREFKKQIKMTSKLHYELAKFRSFKKAARICCISDSCKQDLIEYCEVSPDKIVTTHLGYDPECFFERSRQDVEVVKQKYNLPDFYIVNVSSVFWERKNILGLLKAYKQLQGEGYPHQLVIVGKKGPSFMSMSRFIEENGLNVQCLFSVSTEDLACILTGAALLCFPSFDEGFGLPIVEAMATGCPVVTSNVSAMPEVAGGSALLVDPYCIDSISAAMRKVIENPLLGYQMKRKGLARSSHFLWEKTAKKTLETLESVI